MARRSILRAPIFASLYERYRRELRNIAPPPAPAGQKLEIVAIKKSSYPAFVVKAPLRQNIIFPVEQNQSLEKAIELALAPDAETLKKLTRSFTNAANMTRKKAVDRMKKNKQPIAALKNITEKVNFNPGIYIVRLDKNLNVISAKYVNSVILNPWQYQNQQYLKNSYFAHDTKEKSL
jgi:hypothetical protein